MVLIPQKTYKIYFSHSLSRLDVSFSGNNEKTENEPMLNISRRIINIEDMP